MSRTPYASSVDLHVGSGRLVAVTSDTLAEWLRRRPAKPMGSPRVGSNPTGVVFLFAWDLRGMGWRFWPGAVSMKLVLFGLCSGVRSTFGLGSDPSDSK